MKLHIAYIAGMLDADGTITASIVKTNDLSKNPSFLVGANICGQNLSVLMSIQETLECGNIRAYRSGHSGCYRYTIPRRHMTRVLPMLIPYLQVKREQAELALKGVSLKTHGGYHFKPRRRFSRFAKASHVESVSLISTMARFTEQTG